MEVKLTALTPDAQRVIEKAGRTCYMSRERMTSGSHRGFIEKLIKAGHLSVLEHASATFSLSGVSRSLTHQLVRHRLCSFSQQSQRYVREDNFSWVLPPSIEKNKEMLAEYTRCMEKLGETYATLLKNGILAEDARFVLPNACQSSIVFSGNFRQFRHMISLRGSSKAQWEIREVFIRITDLLKEAAPACFYDFKVDREKRVICRNPEPVK